MTDRALVLGGGGVTGIAWEMGMLAGLADSGVDLTAADVFVGTSAGSVVAAMVAGGTDLTHLYQSQVDGAGDQVLARLGPGLLARYAWAAVRSRNAQQFGARMGALALATKTVTPAQRRTIIASRLRLDDWPMRKVLITAVDAETGELVIFERDKGVPLIDAVAASCAVPGVWPPHEFGGRRYIDGGMRSVTNADLVSGTRKIVILAPIVRGVGPLTAPAKQVAALRAEGSRVELVNPDPAALKAIGPNVLDPSRRSAAAQAGYAQASAAAPALKALWN